MNIFDVEEGYVNVFEHHINLFGVKKYTAPIE